MMCPCAQLFLFPLGGAKGERMREIERERKKKKSCYDKMGKKLPTIASGMSKMSLLIVKQNVQGTTRFVGLSKIHVVITVCSVFSNAWVENFSQYSTADWLSISS